MEYNNMIINITTHVNLNFGINDYDELILEINDFINNEDTDFISTLELILDDLEMNYHKLSNFTVGTFMEFKHAGEFFKDIKEDIEEIDPDEYPFLCNLLITIANNI